MTEPWPYAPGRVVVVTGTRNLVTRAVAEGPTMIRDQQIRIIMQTNGDKIRAELDALRAASAWLAVVDGMADGVDSCAGHWASAHADLSVRVPALWAKFGKAAGRRRNRVLLEIGENLSTHYKHELVGLAFPGPSSVGTYDCMQQMAARRVPCRTVAL